MFHNRFIFGSINLETIKNRKYTITLLLVLYFKFKNMFLVHICTEEQHKFIDFSSKSIKINLLESFLDDRPTQNDRATCFGIKLK